MRELSKKYMDRTKTPWEARAVTWRGERFKRGDYDTRGWHDEA